MRINSGATDAQLEWNRQGDLVKKKKLGREDLEAFETAYNAACGSIARDELGQGEVLLKRAKGNPSRDLALFATKAIRCRFVYVPRRALGSRENSRDLANQCAAALCPHQARKGGGRRKACFRNKYSRVLEALLANVRHPLLTPCQHTGPFNQTNRSEQYRCREDRT